MRAGRYATSLVTLPTDDFPSMTAGQLPHSFKLTGLALRGLIDRTRFAISTEETRYYLNGIYLHAAEGRRRPGAARRRHRRPPPGPRGGTDPRGRRRHARRYHPAARPSRSLRKLLDEESGEVEVALSDTRIQFKAGAITLTSKLIDGTFPEYERVIPKDNDKVLKVGKKDFSDAVARVAAISSERSRPVKMALAQDLLTLSAASPEQGTASEELDGGRVNYTSAPLEIGFQARYLNDITDQIAEKVEFHFSDGSAPTVVRDGGDSSALYVLMPMRV